jgi:hypothetical protein
MGPIAPSAFQGGSTSSGTSAQAGRLIILIDFGLFSTGNHSGLPRYT